jgi:hypothetical protein
VDDEIKRAVETLNTEIAIDAFGRYPKITFNDARQAAALIERLAAERDAAREDAERYRWLRGGPDIAPHSERWPRWEVRNWTGRYWDTLFAEELDAAIDAARKREGA